MSWKGDGRWLRSLTALVGALAVLLAAGCVSVPTDPSVEQVAAGQDEPDAPNVSSADPPRRGAEPAEIVLGFLSAFAEGGQDEHDAREYLTAEQAKNWDPDGSVQFYSAGDPPVLSPDSSRYDYRFVSQLSKGGAYLSDVAASSTTSNTSTWRPNLVQEDDQWRISTPPNSILSPVNLFQALYHQYFLYYFDPTLSVLVPYPIYLRYPPGDPLTPEALLSELKAPDSGFATARNLVVLDSTPQVTIGPDAIANVKVDSQSVPTEAQDRQRFAAQILYTLTQLAPQIKAIQINGGGYQIPGASSGPPTDTVDAGAFPDYAPIQTDQQPTLFGLTKQQGLVSLGDGRSDDPPKPLVGAPDIAAAGIDTFAVSAAKDRIAIVDRKATRLTVSSLPAGPRPITVSGRDLLPPQFTRFGEVWTVGLVEGNSTLIVVGDDGVPSTIQNSAELGIGEVTAFRISPDGTRIAVVRKIRNTYSLSVGSIDRSTPTAIELDGVSPFPFDPSQRLKSPLIDDVTWIDPTTLLVLANNAPYSVDVDGYGGRSFGQAALWDVDRISASISSDGTQPPAVAFGMDDDQSWRLKNGVWSDYLVGLEFATYSG